MTIDAIKATIFDRDPFRIVDVIVERSEDRISASNRRCSFNL
jgi:hypothetical protein